jgi:carbon monoxide dehydrogenase subunit G
MGRLGVSVRNTLGAQILSAEFLTHKTAKCFIEWRIEALVAQGAKYVDVIDKDAQTETRYSAATIAGGVLATMITDWRYAIVRDAA